MKARMARPVEKDSIVDGPGIRTVLWFQGCTHNCYGCHNPQTHDLDGGYITETSKIIEEVGDISFQDGITFSGGDPIMQIDAVLEIAKKYPDINKWLYTGFTFEQLLLIGEKKESMRELLNLLDVVVDGKFEMNLRSFDVKFRGSTNQRVIDVKKSLKRKKVIEKKLEYNPKKIVSEKRVYI